MEKDLNNILQEADRVASESSERLKSLPNDKAFNIRDGLLIKCKNTIESLNIELEGEKKLNKKLENKLKDLEIINNTLEYKLKKSENQINDLKEEIEELISSNEQYKAELQKFSSIKSPNEAQSHMVSTLKSLEYSLSVVQEENAKLKQQLETERARLKEIRTEQSNSDYIKESFSEERLDLEKIETELEHLYEKKHKCMIKDFEKKQETLKAELINAIDEIEIERERYHSMYKVSLDENTQLRQEIKYLQNMLQRKQNQLEKHSQQSLDQLQNLIEKKGIEEILAHKTLVSDLENNLQSLENDKIELEKEISRLKQIISNTDIMQDSQEHLLNENRSLRLKIQELESLLKEEAQENKYLSKSLDEMKKMIQESETESLQEPRKAELIKLKYQTLLQSELQKRLQDKQAFKQHLIHDKEAFIAKLKVKDDRISKLEAEKTELLCEINYLERNNAENSFIEKEKRIMAEDTARVILM